MSSDPFNIVKDELIKSINKVNSLGESVKQLGEENAKKQLSEIRITLKSINWDVQDLEATIEIASKNPAKFSLTDRDIETRRRFITDTKEFIQKNRQAFNLETDENTQSSQQSQQKKPLINIRLPPDLISSTKYTELNQDDPDDNSDYELDTRRILNQPKAALPNTTSYPSSKPTTTASRFEKHDMQIQMEHQDLFNQQEKNLELISSRVSNLKNISQTMNNELDDQAILLGEIGKEMDTAESRMDVVMKRVTKLLHMSSDKRQWTVIGVLIGAILFILVLFAIL